MPIIKRSFPAFTSTWASIPAASAYAAGTGVRVTDIGNTAAGTIFMSDGTNWRPLGGRILLAQKSGLISAPLVTISGSTGIQFALPAGNPVIPASLLPANAAIAIYADVYRRGATAVATFNARLGTAGTVAGDSTIGTSTPFTATDLQSIKMNIRSYIYNSTNYVGQGFGSQNNTANGSLKDRTTNINTAAAMYVSFDISGANIADSFDLISYSVALEF